MASRLFVIDEFVSAPGCAERLRDAYLNAYAPLARERGMVLLHAWRNPPVALESGVATLTLVWEVDGLAGWWRARIGGLGQPAVADWWEESRTLIASHRRAYQESVADV